MTPTRNTAPHGVWTCWPMVACIIRSADQVAGQGVRTTAAGLRDLLFLPEWNDLPNPVT